MRPPPMNERIGSGIGAWWISPCLIGLQFAVVYIAVMEAEMRLFYLLPIITLATGAMAIVNTIVAKTGSKLAASAIGVCLFLLSTLVTMSLTVGAGGI